MTPQPKVMWPHILELTSPKCDLIAKEKEVAKDTNASLETLPPIKQSPRINVRREEIQTFELFDQYPLIALCAEQSKMAKSNLKVKKWAFVASYLLAKEENFGLGTNLEHRNLTKIHDEVNKPPKPYSGPITRSRAHPMSHSITGDSSISTTSFDTEET